jgi:hypothetical protein
MSDEQPTRPDKLPVTEITPEEQEALEGIAARLVATAVALVRTKGLDAHHATTVLAISQGFAWASHDAACPSAPCFDEFMLADIIISTRDKVLTAYREIAGQQG